MKTNGFLKAATNGTNENVICVIRGCLCGFEAELFLEQATLLLPDH